MSLVRPVLFPPLVDPFRGSSGDPATAGGGGAPPWTPSALGSKLTLWLDERGQTQSTGALDSWANQATGIGAMAGVTSGRPAMGRTVNGLSAPDWVSSDALTSASALSALVSSSAYELWVVIDCDAINASSTATGSSFWTNVMILGDTGHFWGLHLRNEGGGLYTVQLGQFGGAGSVVTVTGVRLDETPTFIHGWLSGGSLNLEVNGVAATPVTSVAAISTMTGFVSMGPGGTYSYTGRVATVIVCNAVCSAIERAQMDAYLAAKYGGRFRLFSATQARMWGNGWPDATPIFWSSSAMLAIDTDSPTVTVRGATTSGISTDPAAIEYFDAAIIRGAASARYGTTREHQLPARAGLTWDSGPKAVGGSGTRRIWAVGGCLSGFQGTSIIAAGVPVAYAATTSVPTEPGTGTKVLIVGDSIMCGSTDPASWNTATALMGLLRELRISVGTVSVEGWGSMRCAYAVGAAPAEDFGFVVTAGVLSSDAGDITKRGTWSTRIGAYGVSKALICLGTNDARASVSATDYGVALGARIDAMVSAGLLAANITVMSPIVIVASAPTMTAIRTEAQTVATAKGCAFLNGSTILAAGDLGTDGIHPDPGAAEATLAAAINAAV